MTDEEILLLYSQWSEEYYCAGFLNPDAGTVQEFRKWLKNSPQEPFFYIPRMSYEQEMLKEFHNQEAKDYMGQIANKKLEDYI